jgi:hypothetical protein
LEQFHLSAKGSCQFDGYCKFAHLVDEVLNHHYPRLVFCAPSQVSELTKQYQIHDKTSLYLDWELMDLECELDMTEDIYLLKNGALFVNIRDFEGTLI